MSPRPPAPRRPRSRALTPSELRRACRASEVPVASTAAIEPAARVDQPRVLETLQLAAELDADGYHVFATGEPGTGRRAIIESWLGERAAGEPTPPDIAYVCNFHDLRHPQVLVLPTGSARAFATDVDRLVTDVRRRIREAFESESYRERHRAMHDELDRRRAEVLGSLEERARRAGVALQITPAGVMTLPIVSGRPVDPREMDDLPSYVRESFESAVEQLKRPVRETFATIHDLERDAQERHAELDRAVAVFSIGALFDAVTARWADTPGLTDWLGELREDSIANLDLLRADGEAAPPGLPFERFSPELELRHRYAVNVLVTHQPGAGSPVVIPTDPNYFELFGRIEYETLFGTARTDHRHLRAGAVHRASGGYLVLDAAEVLTRPGVWQRLKEVLRTREARLENLAMQYLLFPGVGLDPQPVAVRTTVVLIGSAELYELLHAFDDDLSRLFRLRADFDDQMRRDAAGIGAYASLLAALRRDRGLPDFDRGAIAALVEHGARLAGHRDRLSTRVRAIDDLATEAAHLARGAGARRVGSAHVRDALLAQRRRSDRLQRRLREATLEGTRRIELSGARSGQVNGLAVAVVGDQPFGHPVRISATAGPGEVSLVSVDREVELSGPVHDKGFLILTGYLTERYGAREPLSLRASLVAEQSYGPIEGDSASAAELLALLSAIADVPLRQGVAVTGSVDQHGRVQAVGGVNEKVEGFFALCDEAGLTGEQGVLVPSANLLHLMLDDDVVRAARERRFRVWPMESIDDALARLTGMRAAAVHERVAARLAAFAEQARAITAGAGARRS